jgi:iron(III) transport system substrate-binding protein
VLQPVGSAEIERLIPSQYRDAEGYWFGLSLRARPIMYAKERVDPAIVPSYASLAEPAMKNRVCVRSSNNIYNQSMLAAMISHDGVAATEAWAKGLVANFARKPSGGDRDQIRAVAAGECDVAIANTYYLARLATSGEAVDREAAGAVAISWPDQDGWGTHVNVSGAGVTRSAKNKANAIKLIEFLVGDEAQKIYASVVYEYPLRDGIPVAPVVAEWGVFEADSLDLTALGANNAEAVRLADRAGWR